MLVIFYDNNETVFLETSKVTWLDEYVTIDVSPTGKKRLYWGPDYNEFKKAVLNNLLDFTVREVPESVRYPDVNIQEEAEVPAEATTIDVPWEVKLKTLWSYINTIQRCLIYSYYPNAYRRLLQGEDLRSDISRDIYEFVTEYAFDVETFPFSGLMPTLDYNQVRWLQGYNSLLWAMLTEGDYSKIPKAWNTEEMLKVMESLDKRRITKC